jgi:hypothetical protein
MHEGSRVVMVQDVQPRNPFPGEGKVLTAIRVFKPVKNPGDKIGDQNRGDEFEKTFSRQDQNTG